MTQDWCPQWIAMKGYLKKAALNNSEIDIYTLLYNKKDYFDDFMQMKENHWNNYYVPYIQYYTNGVLVSESNFISYKDFINSFL